MRAQRIAGYCAIVVPIAVVILVFAWTWSSSAGSGAGLDEGDRPIGFVMLAVLGVGGWLMGTTAMASLFLATTRLPDVARVFATTVVRGPRYAASIGDGPWPDAPVAMADDMSVPHLLFLAFFELPLLLFVAPMLVGWLAQGGVYRPEEATIVAVMAAVATAWTVYLLVRTRPDRGPRPA